MSDRIVLSGVEATGFHGVFDHEKRDGQRFVVDVEVEADLSWAGRTDDLARTVNYGEIGAQVVARIEGEPFDLIERLAEVIAQDVLIHPLVDVVTVTVHKPQAPVGVPFGDVEVVVRRAKDVPVVIALGANLPGPAETVPVTDLSRPGPGHHDTSGAPDRPTPDDTVRFVLGVLGRLPWLHDLRSSGLYRTAPVGGEAVAGQPDYVNAVMVARTNLAPAAVLAELHRIEADFGRTREIRWGARTLDLDLIQYGDPSAGTDVRSDDPELLLPHPRAHERAFVLTPWLDVDPDATLRLGDGVAAVRDLIPSLADQAVRPLEVDG